MKKIKQIILTIIAVTLTVTTACVRDEAEEFPVAADSFSLDISFGKISTRAIGTEEGDEQNLNENRISSLDIFFYQGETLKWHTGSVNYDANTGKATIPITEGKRALFENNTSTSYDIYVVANNRADLSSITEEGDNLEALKQIVFQSTDFVSKGGSEPQPTFVMDGKMSEVVNLNSPDLGTVELKRAASKIRLQLVEVAVPGYTQDGQASASLVHFLDKSFLLDGDSPFVPEDDNDWRETTQRYISGGATTTAAPFYAYANDWNSVPSRETYIELYIPLKNNESNETNSYKYRIPLTPRNATGDEAPYINKLHRNFLYDISTTIRILGSIEEPPVEIEEANYTIKNWSTQDVLVNIQGSHYLVVSERNVTMPNRASYTLTFNSSIPDVKLVEGSLKATYTYVSTDTGEPVTQNVSGNQVPEVIVQQGVASGNITINSRVPINFIPKDIEFKITNGQLEETVIIRQLPATYFTTERGNRSNLRNQLDAAHNNPYMYTITTLAPDGNIIWGFPPLDASGNTVNSAEVAQMVSPRFMMASQMGATQIMSYSNGVTNCNNYWEETTKNGVTVRYDDWRLPTEAEIKYIDDLQHNNNNPLGIVMRGNYYWDAYSGNNAYRMKDPVTSSGNSTSAHVRCIRDIKD